MDVPIYKVQQLLAAVGHSPGAFDGIWGAQSNAALDAALADFSEETASAFWKDIRHFTREEFRCPCGNCGGYPVEPKERLVRFMDTMRRDFNSEIIVVPPDGHSGGSGVRCRAYNATFSNSATNSRHLEGKAADFSAPAVPISRVESYLAAAKAAGKVHYWYRITERAFHVDV